MLLSLNIIHKIACWLQVYLCHTKPSITAPMPSNVSQIGGIATVLPNAVILQDGRELQVDTVILCTGYEYDFPFLSPQCDVQVARGRVTPLFKHIIHAKYPNLSFMAIPYKVAPFGMFYYQANFISSLLAGNMVLPSEEHMRDDIDNDFADRLASGIPEWHAHELGDRQWPYYEELARLGQFDLQTPPVKPLIWNHVFHLKDTNVMGYKKTNYKVIDANAFVEK